MLQKKVRTWTDYLEQVCDCHKIVDEELGFSVRPCDLGIPCGVCDRIDSKIPFERWKKGEIDNNGNEIRR